MNGLSTTMAFSSACAYKLLELIDDNYFLPTIAPIITTTHSHSKTSLTEGNSKIKMAHKITHPIPHMMRQTFLKSLPKMHELGGKDDCPICCFTYKAPKAPAPGVIESLYSMIFPRAPEPEPEPAAVKPEIALRLPCQHVLGSRCITRWISPFGGGHNTCPYVSTLSTPSIPPCKSRDRSSLLKCRNSSPETIRRKLTLDIQCVQKLFVPSKYSVSTHPLWEPLIECIAEYGFTMNENGRWRWNQEKGAAMLSAGDMRAVVPLAQENAAILQRHVKFEADSTYILQKLAAGILTLHLREVVLCLQLKEFGVSIPAFEETQLEPEFPYLLPKKHHTDALFEYFQGQEDFDFETWESNRLLGYVPHREWIECW